jgi:hypothetical protein
MKPLLCLSVTQPWAWAIAEGLKDVENRSWRVSPKLMREIELSGGRILLHASKTITRSKYDGAVEYMVGIDVSKNVIPPQFTLERGGIVAEITLVGCFKRGACEISESRWNMGFPFGWLLRDAIKTPFIPCSGHQQMFQCPPRAWTELEEKRHETAMGA